MKTHPVSGLAVLSRFGRARLALVALLLLACTACQQTRFESLPSSAGRDCDAAWVGSWRIEASRNADADDKPGYWIVQPGCHGYQTLEAEGVSEDEDEFALRYIRHNGRDYLAAASRPDPKAEDQAWEKGIMLFRYEFVGKDRIRVFAADDRQVARLIVDEQIRGRTEVTSGDADEPPGKRSGSIHNLVYGAPADTDRVLRRKDVFATAPWAELRRATDAEIERVKARLIDRRNPEGG